MEASQGAIKYLGLPTKASIARVAPEHVQMRCGIRLTGDDLSPQVAQASASAGIRLCPLLFWYDSTHFSLASHYREFVFAKGRVPGAGFPEDSLGQEMHAEICATAKQGGNWYDVHARYGTYLLLDDTGSMVGHLRGRRYIEEAELHRQGWTKTVQRPYRAPK